MKSVWAVGRKDGCTALFLFDSKEKAEAWVRDHNRKALEQGLWNSTFGVWKMEVQ